jgi:hypothetical protein
MPGLPPIASHDELFGARRAAMLLDQVGTSVQKLGGGCLDYKGRLMTGWWFVLDWL